MPDDGCFTEEALRAFLVGEVSDDLGQAIRAHLEKCPACEDAARHLDAVSDSAIRGVRRVFAVRDPEQTADFTPAPLPAPVGSLPPTSLTGYEILEELGRGGMGVVCKARQERPARLVALKMLLGGPYAHPERRARLLAEAGAIARLQHPNIVQVFEVGEYDSGHGTLPFLVLEFVAGGSLADRLAGTPQPPRQAAALVRTLAEAVHYAHGRGVIHRDLKPANVLLTEEGTPKVNDFGLARQPDQDLTASGAVLGTPSYMAPEQAGGDRRQVGAAADVYALGAVLYEMLTGRPPFRGADVMETLVQVRTQEPVPPARLNPQVPRDLDTVCLKCLEKEPPRRYASAGELADDLGRFLGGVPVRARPAGAGERLLKWARRQPVVAALSAAVLLVFVAGTAVSLSFALLASRRADLADANARRAEEEKQATAAALAQAEVHLAEGLLRPLGPQTPLPSEVELDALWQLARARERVRFLCLERALSRPPTAHQLFARADLAVAAAVGLDRDRRQAIFFLVRPRLLDRTAHPHLRAACAVLAVELAVPDEEVTDEAVRVLTDNLFQVRTYFEEKVLSRSLAAMPGLAGRKQTGEVISRLLDGMDPGKVSLGRELVLGRTAAALVSRLDDGQARPLTRQALAPLFKAVDRADGQVFEQEELTRVLMTYLPRLSSEEATQVFEKLWETFARSTNPACRPALARALQETLPWLNQPHAQPAVALAAEKVLDALTNPQGSAGGERDLALAAAALAMYLSGDRVGPGFEKLLDSLSKPVNEYRQENLVGVVKVLARRLSEAQAQQAVEEILQGISVLADWPAAERWVSVLPLLAPRLGEEQVRRSVEKALDTLARCDRNTHVPRCLAGAAAALSPRVGPESAERVAGLLLSALLKEINPFVQRSLAGALSSLPLPAKARDHAAAAGAITKLLGTPARPSFAYGEMCLFETVAILADWLDAAQARAALRKAAARLLDALAEDKTHPWVQSHLGQALGKHIAALGEAEARLAAEKAAALLQDALRRTLDASAQRELTLALVGVAVPLDEARKHAVGHAISARLLEGLAGSDPWHKMRVQAVIAVTPLLDEGQIRLLAAALLDHMPRSQSSDDWGYLVEGVLALTARLDDEAARRFVAATAGLLVDGLLLRENRWDRLPLLHGLEAAAGKLDRQGLVDLLKRPTCLGETRALLLRKIESNTGQKFLDLWALVDWLAANDPGVDLLRPPERG